MHLIISTELLRLCIPNLQISFLDTDLLDSFFFWGVGSSFNIISQFNSKILKVIILILNNTLFVFFFYSSHSHL